MDAGRAFPNRKSQSGSFPAGAWMALVPPTRKGPAPPPSFIPSASPAFLLPFPSYPG
ncbi:hypothetical protein ASPCADRAFT_212010 [Aspergillus carbonarius ITEM 5010]|uniref:Uncharacterized protein n=1 Tax=Aspergillus carbonarius (strain ITEM 5010) TaxID=602072 RepID=A0A1R3R7G4_ASPC5|nr:hypothetical protein ASPCADRAFT_212010 [Aspergillus carbonarius ITEM 5010]